MEKTIYFAGGCFWGTQHFFKQVEGVKDAICGYANGNTQNPKYEEVYTDTTGFAETVEVRYNPARISLEELTDLFFCIIDPLSLNRQGHDEGTRYRTGIYYKEEAERTEIQKVYAREEAKIGAPLVVELEPLRNFFPAEERHQDYLDKNPDGYCHLPFKAFRYVKLYQDAKLILADETDSVARMAELAALIHERMGFFWTGFYCVKNNELVLGPFQGLPLFVDHQFFDNADHEIRLFGMQLQIVPCKICQKALGRQHDLGAAYQFSGRGSGSVVNGDLLIALNPQGRSVPPPVRSF